MLKRIIRSASVLLVTLIAASPALAADPSPKDATTKAQATIEKGLAYLKSQQKPDGGWQDKDDPPAVTAIVLKTFLQQPSNTRIVTPPPSARRNDNCIITSGRHSTNDLDLCSCTTVRPAKQGEYPEGPWE